MAKDDLFIIGGARTPMTQHVGALKDVSAIELGAVATRGALARTGVAPDAVDHVVFGNVQQSSTDAHYGARHVGLRAGLPIEVPALTVNRLCGSGIQAAVSGAQQILLGEAGVVVAGGMESMSQVPHVLRGLRSGLRLGQGKLEDWLWEGLNDPYAGCSMAITAENCAAKYGITREQADRYALRSQQRAHDAWTSGRMAEEVVAVEVKSAQGRHHRRSRRSPAARDDARRPGRAADRVQEGRRRHRRQCQRHRRRRGGAGPRVGRGGPARGLKPLARIVSWAAVGVEPTLMGMGPAPAIRKALERAGLTLDQLDLVEINEAFAPQYLACEKELGLDPERSNVNGGAIALGHPLGASGARLLLTLALELRRRKARYGVASACIGGGQGIAMIIEAA